MIGEGYEVPTKEVYSAKEANISEWNDKELEFINLNSKSLGTHNKWLDSNRVLHSYEFNLCKRIVGLP